MEQLTDLIVGTDIKLIGAGIDVATYTRFAPKLKQNDFGGNKYVAPKSTCDGRARSPIFQEN